MSVRTGKFGFVLELRHTSCAKAKPIDAPLLTLIRGDQYDGVYRCPLCNHTLHVSKRRIKVAETTETTP